LNYLLDLVLSDETKVFSTGNGHYFSVSLRVFVFAETDKGTGFGIDALDSLSSFADDKSYQSHWNFKLNLVRAVNGSAVHLSLSLHDEIQLFSHALHRFGVALHEDISGFGTRST
jgi:hypothetical protein